MRLSLRHAVVACGVAALAACSSSGTNGRLVGASGNTVATPSGVSASSPTGGGSGGTVSSSASSSASAGHSGNVCEKLRAASTQLSGIGGKLSDPATAKAAFAKLIAVYQAIGDGAPPNVQKATNDLIGAFKAAEKAYSDPSHPDLSALSGLSTKLGPDVQVISAYLSAHCH